MNLYAEVFIRFICIGMLVGLCTLVLRCGLKTTVIRYAFFLNVAMVCLLMTAGTPPWALHGPYWFFLNVISVCIFPLAWLFGLSLFDEDFRISKWKLTVLLVYAVPPGFFALSFFGFEPQWLEGIRVSWLIMSLGLMVHVAYQAIAGRSDDLVEARRRERVRVTVAIAALLVFAFAAAEVFGALGDENCWRYLLLLALPYSLWMMLWMARAHPEVLAFDPVIEIKPAPTAIDARDKPIKARLDILMEEDRIYREQGLTIKTLAEKVGVPEHQLRVLINKSMGFRNFAGFLNHYRIAEAQEILSDPERARLPILTIAMDVGYSSVTPFNSAFKARVGKTPTAFRNDVLLTTS